MKTAQCKPNGESAHHSIVNREKQAFFPDQTHSKESFFSPVTIQPKLKIGSPDDQFERQADRVAEAVVSSPAPNIQRKSTAKEEELQMKSGSGLAPKTAPSDISKKIQTSGSGTQLPDSVNNEMSQKIGADFSSVNIHNDHEASLLNQSLGARAFTHGNNIFFNSGEYNPGSREGKRLLAHELTHVVQQGGDKKIIQRQELSDDARRDYVTNIIAEMGTTHTDYNDGAQDADQAITAASQANADMAKAIFSISMAIIIPGFGGVVSSIATRFGVTLTESVADHIGGVIGEAAKIAGEGEIANRFQSSEQNELFIAIANGLEEAARKKREYLLNEKYNREALTDNDLVVLYNYWRTLGQLDRGVWSSWFQDKYQEFLLQVSPIGEQTEGRYGVNKLRWIEGQNWRGLALTGEGRLYMATNRPTFMAWVSPFFREAATRRHEQAVGSRSVSTIHYTSLETDGRTTRSHFQNVLDSPYSSYTNIIREQATGSVRQRSGSNCPSCHGQGGGIGPEFDSYEFFDSLQIERENSQTENIDVETLRWWIESATREGS